MVKQIQRELVAEVAQTLGIGIRIGRRTWYGGCRESEDFYFELPQAICKASAVAWFERELDSNCFHQDGEGFWHYDYSSRYVAAIFAVDMPKNARQIDFGQLKQMLKSKYRGKINLDEISTYRVNQLRGNSSKLLDLLPDCSERQVGIIWRLIWAIDFAADTLLVPHELYVLAGIQKFSRRQSPFKDELEHCFVGRGYIHLPNGLWVEGTGTGNYVQECEKGIVWHFRLESERPQEPWSEQFARRWRLEYQPAIWGRFTRFMRTFC